MAVPWGLITFVIGIFYGWLTPGRQNKTRMFKTGLLIGLVLAVVLGLIGLFAGVNPLGIGNDMLSIILSVIILALLFILGVWIGDLIEGSVRRRTA